MENHDRLVDTLEALTALDGVSGFEEPVAAWLRRELEPLADRVEADGMGNLYLVREGRPGGPRVMVAAHTDEIGGMVSQVEPSGFLRFEKLGGWQDPLLPGRFVRMRGHLGIIGCKPGHFLGEEERRRVREHRDLYIDVGARSATEVTALGIRAGDPVAFYSPLVRMAGGMVAGKALDDRLGCAVVVEWFRRTHEEGRRLDATVVVAFTVQEEVGLRGATVAAYRVNPDLALVVDTIPSGDTPDMASPRPFFPVALSKGPVIQLMSGSGQRGHILSPHVRDLLEEAACRSGVPYQTVAFTRGTTDGSAIHLARQGVPTGVITIPRRYSHSPVEMAHVSDVIYTLRLLDAALGHAVRLS